ncbi:hypothetical protein GGR57DRAFT_507879 [Xylariaceae sp. FL1272]|nr:hypothetical protein GGR57DRAFT_507879 [Xylariaceae sp. FL1272]
MKWTDDKERQVIHAVIHHGNLGAPTPDRPLGSVSNWSAIHAALVQQGFTCSSDAVQSRLVQIHRTLAAKLPATQIPPRASTQQTLSIVSGVAIGSSVPVPDNGSTQDFVVDPKNLSQEEKDRVNRMENKFLRQDDEDFESSVRDYVVHSVALLNARGKRNGGRQ